MKTQSRTTGGSGAHNHRQAPLSKFARSLMHAWRTLNLPVADANIILAVSGGADSTALLLALDELARTKKLNVRILVAHLDHRLRKESADDARWVKELAQMLGHKCLVKRVDVKSAARRASDNLEQAARKARYQWFAQSAQKRDAALVLTAHTMDDQAETVLLNLLRGSGTDGLGGMEVVRTLDRAGKTKLVRPLLSWARRRDTESYCRARGIDFRRDQMNEDTTFARVRMRHELLPLMESLNPRFSEALARAAELLRDDGRALDSAAQRLLQLSRSSETGNEIRTDLLSDAPAALRRRALRQWLAQCRGDLRRLELVHIRAVENLVTQNRGGRTIELPGRATVSRKAGRLKFKRRTSGRSEA